MTNCIKNYEYLKKADLGRYSGEWVIVAKARVVAHGTNLEELYSDVDAKYPDEDRITLSVPEKGDYVL